MVRENKTECKMTFRNEEPHVNKCFPRVRGDVPSTRFLTLVIVKFSPRARGCSALARLIDEQTRVFPACAGMFPLPPPSGGAAECFPRVRGDVPIAHAALRVALKFSPRARGCSRCTVLKEQRWMVFPACAGMFLFLGTGGGVDFRFPRVRGDVPRRWA